MNSVDPAPGDDFRTVSVIVSDSFLTSDERRRAYEDDAFNLDPIASFGSHERFASDAISLRCNFPPGGDARVGTYPILGTAVSRHSVFRCAENTSLSVRIEGDQIDSLSVPWAELAEMQGVAKIHSSNLRRLLARGHSSATALTRILADADTDMSDLQFDESDELDFDLLSALDSIMRRLPSDYVSDQKQEVRLFNEEDFKAAVGINGMTKKGDPSRVGMHSRVLVVLTVSLCIDRMAENSGTDLSDFDFETTIVAPERTGVTARIDEEGGGTDNSLVALAVSLSGTVHNVDLARSIVEQAQRELEISTELAASQVLLLRSMAKLCKHVEHKMESIENVSESDFTLLHRTNMAYDFISTESFAKRVLEGGWCLDEPGYVNDRVLGWLDRGLGLTAYWRAECRRLRDVCSLGVTLIDSRTTRDRQILANEGSKKTLLSAQPSILLVDRWSRDNPEAELESRGDHSRMPLLRRLVLGYPNLNELERKIKRRRPRLVEFHPFARSHLVAQSISGRLTTATMMTATSGLLLGLLVGDGSFFSSTGEEVVTLRPPPIDIFLLFVSTFSFFFETLILAYASRCLSFSTVGIAKLTERASDASVYLGQYSFVVALPLAVSRLVGRTGLEGDTLFLAIAICVMAMAFLIVYFQVLQAGSFSLLSNPQVRESEADYRQYCVFSPTQRRFLLIFLHTLSALLFLGTVLELADVGPSLDWLMWPTVVVLIGLLLALVMLAWRLAAIVELRYFEVDEWDLMGNETSSFQG